MATRLLLEGADLTELLAHVRDEYGHGTKVVRAERIRSGGFAGFFAKERYELTVDVPETPPPLTLTARRRAAAGLDGLLAAADAADVLPDGTPAGSLDLGTSTLAESSSGGDQAPGGELPAAGPRVSTGGAEFASVLDLVRSMAGAPAPADIEVPAPFEPMAPPSARPTRRVGDTGDAAADEAGADEVNADDSGPDGVATGTRETRPGSTDTAPAAPDRQSAADEGALRDDLHRLGVPDRLLEGSPLTVPAVVARIPVVTAPSRAPGTVVVVVGTGADVDAVAPVLADRLRCAPDAVVRAGTVGSRPDDLPADARPRGSAGRPGAPLASPQAVARWRRTADEAPHAWVVALAVGPTQADRTAAAGLLRGLRGDTVWAVVDARTKAADVRRWTDEVAAQRPERTVDAVAVRGLFDTAEPGTVLDLGVPVAWMDGVPATSLAWASVLSASLAGAAVPDAGWG
ncbi:hypothetical protein ACTHAM_002110 [Cellulomonas soli]|uniref:hypothetical protein n=1 Tax=Cellulomonas soli TaxID=931535 RepID=UPI003F879058